MWLFLTSKNSVRPFHNCYNCTKACLLWLSGRFELDLARVRQPHFLFALPNDAWYLWKSIPLIFLTWDLKTWSDQNWGLQNWTLDKSDQLLYNSVKNSIKTSSLASITLQIVFCCYNCLDLPWEKFFQVRVTFFPCSWEQEYCFETVGREFVTFSRHYSCLRELGKQVTNTWKKLWAWYKSRQL